MSKYFFSCQISDYLWQGASRLGLGGFVLSLVEQLFLFLGGFVLSLVDQLFLFLGGFVLSLVEQLFLY